jgi:cadmium resistance protein CadD (predicted permease)
MNVGKWDRVIRTLVGLAILAFLPRTTWALLGLIPLATGIAGYCPIYRLFGWSTASSDKTVSKTA